MKVLQVLFLIFCFTIFVNAQKATLTGTIYDEVGAIIPKAQVIAINEKGEKFITETNEEGIYTLSLPYNSFESKKSTITKKIFRYEIIIDLRERGFEKRVIKDFMFIPAYAGKMFLDIALDTIDPEPCGYSGGDCLS